MPKNDDDVYADVDVERGRSVQSIPLIFIRISFQIYSSVDLESINKSLNRTIHRVNRYLCTFIITSLRLITRSQLENMSCMLCLFAPIVAQIYTKLLGDFTLITLYSNFIVYVLSYFIKNINSKLVGKYIISSIWQ